jgi:8-oxo-dGTP pyrophosphatase MutT (NUDIX family)
MLVAPKKSPSSPHPSSPPSQSHDVHILHLLSQTSKLVVGAAIFHPGVSLKEPKILLLKRATHEQYYPNTYEIPGGKVEAWESVAEAVLREVREETGLDVDVGSNGEGKGLVAALELFIYYTGGAVEKGSGDGEKVQEGGKAQGERKFCLQLNYVASVKNADFRVHEEEHSGGVWVTEAEVEVAGFGMTEEMRMVVKDAFGWKKRSAS